jgi:putative glycosyltransferase (TIGR04348 family)
VVALAGTDIYSDVAEHSEAVLRSLDCADALIGLHDLVASALPACHRDKVTVIYQSAQAPEAPAPRSTDRFEVLVVGHLRDVKDPLRTARAARLLPTTSRIDVVHLGGAHTPAWARRAEIEMAENTRYHWHGEVSEAAVRTWLSRARLMVLSSFSEGGANVISEAVAAGTPVLASRIDGSIGLLGHDYAGYFPTGDAEALASLLTRAEIDGAFLSLLEHQSAKRSRLFQPTHELELWRHLLTGLFR